MTSEIKLWEIENDQLESIEPAHLDLEGRLEDWLEKDISILSDDLLVIGRQVKTDFGGSIDLLCMNSAGDLVIVELKRDRTPRDITAQTIDYASWVQDLSYDDVTCIADGYLKTKSKPSLIDSFRLRFGTSLPEVLNDSHSMLIVGTLIDPASERIINYLSAHDININATTFRYFEKGVKKYVARTFLVTQIGSSRPIKRKGPNLSLEELQKVADENGVGDMFNDLVSALQEHFDLKGLASMLSFSTAFEDSNKTFFNLIPNESNKEKGLLFKIYDKRFMRYFGLDTVSNMLPAGMVHVEPPPDKKTKEDFSAYQGYFRTKEEVDHFIDELDKLKDIPITTYNS